ncbi:unnamed protein product, partial [Dovyalis caffra]
MGELAVDKHVKYFVSVEKVVSIPNEKEKEKDGKNYFVLKEWITFNNGVIYSQTREVPDFETRDRRTKEVMPLLDKTCIRQHACTLLLAVRASTVLPVILSDKMLLNRELTVDRKNSTLDKSVKCIESGFNPINSAFKTDLINHKRGLHEESQFDAIKTSQLAVNFSPPQKFENERMYLMHRKRSEYIDRIPTKGV